MTTVLGSRYSAVDQLSSYAPPHTILEVLLKGLRKDGGNGITVQELFSVSLFSPTFGRIADGRLRVLLAIIIDYNVWPNGVHNIGFKRKW